MINPKDILMIKSHSLGVGDLLRSSAAWRALHDRYPGVRLHLLFLSKHPGYPTEALMHDHHLLASSHFVTIREGHPGQAHAKKRSWWEIAREVRRLAEEIQPDLVIDFEPSGIRTSMLTRVAARAVQGLALGIAQFPGRGWFYDIASPSVHRYRLKHGLPDMMEYAERDFVALSALGIERNGVPIELKITPAGCSYADELKSRLPSGTLILGLNIGCGTPDALPRRPPLEPLTEALHLICQDQPCLVLLSGATFEKNINDEFIALYQRRYGEELPMWNLAGESSLSALTGLISLCGVFITSDSGPYHMSVAMRKPTVVWFMRDEPPAIHHDEWCKCLIKPTPTQFANAAIRLIQSRQLSQ